MSNHTKGMKANALVAGLAVALVAGIAIARESGASNELDPAADVLARIDSPRLASATATGGKVVVEARASEGGADGVRSLWYGTLASAAIAQKTAASAVTRRVIDSRGAVLADETDAVAAGQLDAFAPLDRSANDIVQGVRARAQDVGARLVSTHYIRLYGGVAELVVQPDNPSSFAASGGANVGALLGDQANDHRPYLVTVVGAGGAPLFILGWTPAVGGGIGQGIGWQAPGVDSNAIWGAAHVAGRRR